MELVAFDIRHDMFNKATRFIDYEVIEGDIVEFGVYTGRSLALLSYYHQKFKNDAIHGSNTPSRNVIGIDSFEGLANSNHVRWTEGSFKTNHSWHPFLKIGERVTPEQVAKLFDFYNLNPPKVISSFFSDVLTDFCDKVALIHIDCDLYESTLDALNLVKDKIQDGTIILFDDWFNYKGSPDKGEQKAFHEFLSKNPNITAIQYQPYATFCNSFILKIT